MLAALRRAVNTAEPETLDAFKKREMEMCDGKATKRVTDMIKAYLND